MYVEIKLCGPFIYCEEKRRFLILIFVIEVIETCTIDMPRKSVFKDKYS